MGGDTWTMSYDDPPEWLRPTPGSDVDTLLARSTRRFPLLALVLLVSTARREPMPILAGEPTLLSSVPSTYASCPRVRFK